MRYARRVIHLGPFELIEPAGSGGMATVWRARHRSSGTQVAVKVLHDDLDDEMRSWFRSEVRGQASLRHPAIALVLDHGEVPRGVEGLAAGKPWLAIEWASAGPIGRLRGEPWPWPMLREMLLALLDALAHAHARGIIHRDVKLANLLLASRDDLRPGLKLCDFGIASTPSATKAQASSGTPTYMAPEQLTGRIRDQGPWTDLYSVGVVAWRLAHGNPPHRGPIMRLYESVLRGPPRTPAPPGFPREFDDWLQRMLDPKIDRRFRRAVDAARALLAMGEVSDAGHSTGIDLGLFRATGRLMPLRPGARIQGEWERGATPPIPVQLTGAGLGVWAIRRLPMIGRTAARNALWEQLCTVDRTERPRVAVVRGPIGIGKSELGRWLGERALELGAAGSWTLGPHGIRPMVRRALSAEGLSDGQLQGVVSAEIDRLGGTRMDAATALALVSRDGADPSGRVRLRSTREQLGALGRLLHLHAAEGPVVLHIRDQPLLADGIRIARSLADAPGELPLLVVLELRDDNLAEQPVARALLQDALEEESWTAIRLRPLGSRERTRLVRALLPLDPSLEGQVVERCAGNPMWTVQLVRTLVNREALRSRASGFALKPGEALDFPEGLTSTWIARIAALVGPLGEDAVLAVEIAAVLGMEFDPDEWSELAPPGPATLAAIHEAMVDQHLWTAADGGRIAWTHAMAREATLARAREASRLAGHHLAAAALLDDDSDTLQTLRRAEHLLAGGRPAQAAKPMIRAALKENSRWSRAEFTRWLERMATAVTALGAEPTDKIWIELAKLEVRHGYLEADLPRQVSILQAARERAVAGGHARLAWQMRRDLIVSLRIIGRFDEALEIARELLDAAPDLESRLNAHEEIARIYVDVGRYSEALELAIRGLALFEQLPAEDQRAVSTIYEVHAAALMYVGDREGARSAFRAYLEYARAQGNLHEQGSAWNCLGELARQAGELDEAERCYRLALEHWESRGSVNTPVAQLNLGMVAVAREDGPAARRAARAFELTATKPAAQWLKTTYDALRLAAHALTGDIERAAGDLEALDEALEQSARPSPDDPWLLERAARAMESHGADAAALRRVAAREWARVGRDPDAERTEAQLESS